MKYIFTLVVLLGLSSFCVSQDYAKDATFGKLEVVATLNGALPTGISVSNDGRIFVNYPQWGDDPKFTVGEIVNGKEVAYPNAEINRLDLKNQQEHLVSVQSVVVDTTGKRLWMLDTGSMHFAPTTFGGPKLIGVDLATNKIFKKIIFPTDVAGPSTYLNDIRFDLNRGKEGMAFITDSGAFGIIVVDLATGKGWRRLQNHPSTHPQPGFITVVEGKIFEQYVPGQPKYLSVGSDGIAISADHKWLYYCALSGRHFYRVSIDALADPNKSEEDVAKTVEDLGEKGGFGDGMESDAQGRVYYGDCEHESIHRWNPDGKRETVVHDPRILWPDTLSFANDGYLYFTTNQIERQGDFYKDNSDHRVKPWVIYKVKTDGTRINQ
jgi:sugar lactone lactonase YvrE